MKQTQKIVSVILTLAMVVSMLTVSVSAADWSLPDGAADEPTIRFGLLADSHITITNAAMKKAASSFSALGVDALVLSGDIVMHQATETTEAQMVPKYTLLKEALSAAGVSTVANTADVAAGTIPLIYATGNHEFPIGSTDEAVCKTSLDVYESEMGCTQNSHTVINGIHFITSGGKNYNSTAFHQEEWIKAEIEAAKAANPANPIFLVLHHPMHDTVQGSSSGDLRYTDKFRAYLNQNPNVILLSAHTHLAVQNSQGIWQDGFTAVTAGYTGGGNQLWSQGMLIEVTDSVVKFYKMDYQQGGYIKEPWVVDITDLGDYTEAGRANAKAPRFAANEEIVATDITSETATIVWNDASVEPTAAYQDDYVASYNVKVVDKDGNVTINKKVENDYWRYTEETVNSLLLEGLTGGMNYTVKITATSGLDKVSDVIETEFSTIDPALDEAVYKVMQAEEDVTIYSELGDDITATANANQGDFLRVPGGHITYTYSFKPTETGYYTFEFVGDGDKEQTGIFKINGTEYFNDKFATTGSWGVANPQKTKLAKIYMQAGLTYKLEFMPILTCAFDCFNLYFENVVEAEADANAYVDFYDGASQGMAVNLGKGAILTVPVNVSRKALYSVSVSGKGNATFSVTADGVNAEAVSLNCTEFDLAENAGVFYMDAGTKNISLTVDDGSFVCDYVSIKKLSDIATKANVIEAEQYMGGNVRAQTALYGDYTDGIFNSGVSGTDLTLSYNVDFASDANYRFDVVGSGTGTVTITVDGTDSITGTIYEGNWKALRNYIGSMDVSKGTHNIIVETAGYAAINAITFEKGEGVTEFLINAESDFDKEAGHGVGWYDNTPDSYDDQWMDTTAYSFVDVSKYSNRVGGGMAYMTSSEWFSYKVNIDYPGYYRILLGLHSVNAGGDAAPFTVTVNGDENNAISRSIYRSVEFGNAQGTVPYDDFGLIWLNEGENTIKVKFDSIFGDARFDAFRLVTADAALYKTSVAIGGELECETSYSQDSSIGVASDGEIRMYPGNWAQFTLNALQAGTYDITLTANGSDATPPDAEVQYPACSVIVTVNGTSIGTVALNNTDSWDSVASPVETLLASVNLNEGANTIKLEAFGNTSSWNSLSFATTGDERVMNLTAGTYKVKANLGNWYAGEQYDASNAKVGYGKEYKPVLYAAVYNANGEFVKSKLSATIDSTNTITIENLTVSDGETVKLMIWDGTNLKPLIAKRAVR